MFEALKTFASLLTEVYRDDLELFRKAGLVSLYVTLNAVFYNLVALVITSSKATGGNRELQVSGKLEHGPRHYIYRNSLGVC